MGLFKRKSNSISSVTSFPFDLRYVPDLIFYAPSKVATIFPDDIGQGTLLICPCVSKNFVELCLLIDDYVVQFSSTGYMYILDIVQDKCTKINVTNMDSELFQSWILQIESASTNMNDVYKYSPKALQYLQMFTNTMFYFTYGNIDRNTYIDNLNGIKSAFGVAENSNKMEIRNRAWYYDGKKQTWGHVAHCIFRDDFSYFLNY